MHAALSCSSYHRVAFAPCSSHKSNYTVTYMLDYKYQLAENVSGGRGGTVQRHHGWQTRCRRFCIMLWTIDSTGSTDSQNHEPQLPAIDRIDGAFVSCEMFLNYRTCSHQMSPPQNIDSLRMISVHCVQCTHVKKYHTLLYPNARHTRHMYSLCFSVVVCVCVCVVHKSKDQTT